MPRGMETPRMSPRLVSEVVPVSPASVALTLTIVPPSNWALAIELVKAAAFEFEPVLST